MDIFAKRGELWLPERERVRRYFPRDLDRYDRYRKRWQTPKQAIAFVQKKSNTNTTGASIAATYDAGPTQNNTLIICISSNDPSCNTPSGWSVGRNIVNATEGDFGTIFYKTAGAGESSTVTLDGFAGNTKLLSIAEFSGLDATPLDTSNETGRTTSVTSLSTNSITTSVADELMIVLVFVRDATVSAGSWNNATLLHSLDNTTSFAGYSGYRIVSATGTYSSTASWTSAGTALGGIIGLKIAAAAGGTPLFSNQGDLSGMGVGGPFFKNPLD